MLKRYFAIIAVVVLILAISYFAQSKPGDSGNTITGVIRSCTSPECYMTASNTTESVIWAFNCIGNTCTTGYVVVSTYNNTCTLSNGQGC